jgi:protein TonB
VQNNSALQEETVSLGRPKHWLCLALLALVTGLSLGTCPALADEDGGRKVKTKVAPVYPELAKRMNVTGTVKLQVVIAASGQIKSTKLVGGHPLLIEPAMDAIKKWRYEPGSEETTTTVEFHFTNGTNN